MVKDAQYPDDWTPLRFERQFNALEYERMSLGVIPEDMDDKWYVYLEDDTFYFHRSWTGLCIFRMRLLEVRGAFVVSEAAVARFPPPSRPWWRFWQHSRPVPPGITDAVLESDVDLLNVLVDVALLGKPDPRAPGRQADGTPT